MYTLKHPTTLFALSDRHILSREWRVIVEQAVQTNNYGSIILKIDRSGVTELCIMRDPHYGRMCFRSVKTLGALHCLEKVRLYPIRISLLIRSLRLRMIQL